MLISLNRCGSRTSFPTFPNVSHAHSTFLLLLHKQTAQTIMVIESSGFLHPVAPDGTPQLHTKSCNDTIPAPATPARPLVSLLPAAPAAPAAAASPSTAPASRARIPLCQWWQCLAWACTQPMNGMQALVLKAYENGYTPRAALQVFVRGTGGVRNGRLLSAESPRRWRSVCAFVVATFISPSRAVRMPNLPPVPSPSGSFWPVSFSMRDLSSCSTRIWPSFSGLSLCHKMPGGLRIVGVVRIT